MKNIYKTVFTIGLGILFPAIIWSQGVTIGSNSAPDPSAVLDVQSHHQGFLLPRLTSVQRNAIPSPHIGLQIYNTDNDCLEMYFPSGWKAVACDCVQPPPAASQVLGPTHVCEGASNQLFVVQAVPGAFSYIWSIDAQDTLKSVQGGDTLRVSFSNVPGNRTISVVASNPCGNATTYSFTVDVSNPDSTFSISPSPVYTSGPSTFTASENGASYIWSFGSGTPASSTNQSEAVNWSVPGTYPVQLQVTDADGCMSGSTESVLVSACQPFTHTFTNCGQTGRTGPSQSQCNNTYGSGIVAVNNGIQEWTVPHTGNYRIEVAGAKGGSVGSYQGGNGYKLRGDFSLTTGQVLKIVVGQIGTPSGSGAGGGGGSYVVLANPQTPLIIAGGGGGATSYSNTNGYDGVPGTSGGNSSNPQGCGSGAGGTGGANGNGGAGGCAAGGAGYLNNGGAGSHQAEGGYSFGNASGPLGGNSTNGSSPPYGGYGGGGAGSPSNGYGGGGGGYSGGGGGGWSSIAGNGGGGGSFNSGSNPSNLGTHAGMGYVTITRLCQ